MYEKITGFFRIAKPKMVERKTQRKLSHQFSDLKWVTCIGPGCLIMLSKDHTSCLIHHTKLMRESNDMRVKALSKLQATIQNNIFYPTDFPAQIIKVTQIIIEIKSLKPHIENEHSFLIFLPMLSRTPRMRQSWCLRLRVKKALTLRIKQVPGWHLRVTPAYLTYLTLALAQVLGKDVSRRTGTLAQGKNNFFCKTLLCTNSFFVCILH